MTMSRRDELYEILEMEPSNDPREIKRAYSRMIRKVHPEDNPEEWTKVHDAYEELIKYAPVRQNTSRRVSGSDLQNKSKDSLEDKVKNESTVTANTSNKKKARKTKTTTGSINTEYGLSTEQGIQTRPLSEDLEEEPALIRAVDAIADASKKSDASFSVPGEVFNLLKAVPSLTKSLYGNMTIHTDALQKLRNHPDYMKSLRNPQFLEEYTIVLKECCIYSSTAKEILGDLAEIEAVDSMGEKDENAGIPGNNGFANVSGFREIKDILNQKIKDYETMSGSGKYKRKKLLYDGGWLTRFFRGKYYLVDYVRNGAQYNIEESSKKTKINKKTWEEKGILVFNNRIYKVTFRADQAEEAYYLSEIRSKDYDSPEQCVMAIKSIRNFFEEYYEKRKFLFFMRSVLIYFLFMLLPLSIFTLFFFIRTDWRVLWVFIIPILGLLFIWVRAKLIGGVFKPTDPSI